MQAGHLSATPDEEYKEEEKKTFRDRYNRLKSFGLKIEFPPIIGVEYILEHLDRLGWVSSSGMGITSISYQEIESYIRLTNTSLTPDEVLLIKEMSSLYASYSQEKNPNVTLPYKRA